MKKMKQDETNEEDETVSLPRNAALGIFTHAVLDLKTIVKVPDGITIKKQNVGAPGCITFADIYKKMNDPRCIQITHDALVDLRSCINPRKYFKTAKSNARLKVFKDFRGLHGIGEEDDRCSYFESNKSYNQKEYAIDSELHNMIFMVEGLPVTDGKNWINLMECDITTLTYFFNLDGKLTSAHAIELHNFIEARKFVIANNKRQYNRRELTTTDIFKLFEVARDCLNVKNVNILDNSCNVIFARKDDPVYVQNRINKGYRLPPSKRELLKLKRKGFRFGGKTRKLKKTRIHSHKRN